MPQSILGLGRRGGKSLYSQQTYVFNVIMNLKRGSFSSPWGEVKDTTPQFPWERTRL